MRTLLLQRICSSWASGEPRPSRCWTGTPLRTTNDDAYDRGLSALTQERGWHLRTIVEELSWPEAADPKLAAVRHFLTEHRTEGKTWLEHGCIIFSQYYDTALIASALTREAAARRAGRRLCRLGQERPFSRRRLRLRRT